MELFANIFDAAVAVMFMLCMLGKKSKTGKVVVASVICFLLLFAKTDKFDSVLLQTFTTVAILMLYAVICLEGKTIIQLVIAFSFRIILTVSNILAVSIILILTDFRFQEILSSNGAMRNAAIIINKVLLLLCLLTAIYVYRKNKMRAVDWIIPFIVIIFEVTVGEVLVQFILQNSAILDLTGKREMIIISLGVSILSILIFVVSVRLSKKHNLEMDNIELSSKMETQMATIDNVHKMYEETSILKHDLKHYLTATLGMLNTNEIEEAKLYLQEVIKDTGDNNMIFQTKSSVVNAVLNNKYSMCQKNNIQMKVFIDGEIPNISERKLSILLSNLFDNAIYASKDSKEHEVSLDMFNVNDMFQIVISNSIDESVLKKNPELASTKQDKSLHGIGIKSIRKIIKELDGFYQIREQNNRFIFEIYIPIQNAM